MPIFHYQALDPSGTLHKGSQDATSKTEVRQFLREKQWFPTEIRTSRFAFSRRKSGGTSKTSFQLPKLFSRSNHQRSLTLFTRQIEVLLDATIPYDKAFQLIIPQTQDPKFQSILSDVRGRVVEGKSLADAMARHPEAFPAMYVSMVRSGENGGTLGVIMRRLAEYFEQREQLRGRLRSAMIYPAFMTVFGIAVVAFMVTAVVPKIAQIFEAQEAALPLPTRLLLGLSETVIERWWALLLGLGLITAGFSTFWESPAGQRWKDRLELTLPGLGRLRIKILVARFCQTLGLLLKSGVDLKTALEISKHVVVNRNFIARLDQLIIDVHNKGMPLSAAMARI